jgi:hypothetical protein
LCVTCVGVYDGTGDGCHGDACCFRREEHF